MKIKMVNKIIRKKDPYKDKVTLKAHRKANIAEKKADPKAYSALTKFDRTLGKHEFAGENFKNGTIEESKKVPKKLRKNLAIHEEVEQKYKKIYSKRK